jgi:predicted DNA-binding transcriptional regulator YafY
MLDIERCHKMIRLLRSRRVVTREAFMEATGASLATFKRDLAYLKDRAGAEVEFERDLGGYVLRNDTGREYFPGLWFSAGEIHGLLTLYQLAASLEPGLLGEHLTPLVDKLEKQLEGEGVSREALGKRIRVLHMAHRAPDPAVFEVASIAALGGRKVRVKHYNRSTGERLDRELSPQRLVHYRDNWYLDAWCHTREALRSFALDAIEQAELLDAPAKRLPEKAMQAHYASSYGIFSGKADQVAVLRFSPQRSRWIAKERWHPEQEMTVAPDGAVTLRLPYHAPQELVMDILRHGDQVEVLAPPALRDEVARALKAAAARY